MNFSPLGKNSIRNTLCFQPVNKYILDFKINQSNVNMRKVDLKNKNG